MPHNYALEGGVVTCPLVTVTLKPSLAKKEIMFKMSKLAHY
jgi:hypothetical protein